MASILVLNGPNLNMLGKREPMLYGSKTLIEINTELKQAAEKKGHQITSFQSNTEDALINRIHQAHEESIDLIIFNPAAFTHTSIALRDALLAINIPFIEVHLSNPQARESFRRKSFFSDIAIGSISGFHSFSYLLALDAAENYLSHQISN